MTPRVPSLYVGMGARFRKSRGCRCLPPNPSLPPAHKRNYLELPDICNRTNKSPRPNLWFSKKVFAQQRCFSVRYVRLANQGISPIKWEMQELRDSWLVNGLPATDEAKPRRQSFFDMSVKHASYIREILTSTYSCDNLDIPFAHRSHNFATSLFVVKNCDYVMNYHHQIDPC